MSARSIDAELVTRVAAQTGTRELDIKRVLLGLPPLVGCEAAMVAALLAAGVDETFLTKLRASARLAPAAGRAA